MLTMEKSDRAIQVGRAIRQARKQQGKVMRQVAEHLGVNVAAVGNWEGGQNLPSYDNLLRTAEYLGVDAVALGRGEVKFLEIDDVNPPGDAEFVTPAMPAAMGALDVPIMGSTIGGDDGDFTFNGEVAGMARRPPGILHLRNVYALHVLSDSMVPRYDPGEMIFVGGREPVPGDHVVIEMFPEEGAKAGKSYIKKLVRRTAKEVIVRQYNPDKEYSFDRYGVKQIWRVIPQRELLGF